MKDTFYIKGKNPVMGHLATCVCGRKIVVQLPLIGVPHHRDAYVTCLECMVVDPKFRENNPEIAAQIDGWKND
jgi:hypothetical protein